MLGNFLAVNLSVTRAAEILVIFQGKQSSLHLHSYTNFYLSALRRILYNLIKPALPCTMLLPQIKISHHEIILCEMRSANNKLTLKNVSAGLISVQIYFQIMLIVRLWYVIIKYILYYKTPGLVKRLVFIPTQTSYVNLLYITYH